MEEIVYGFYHEFIYFHQLERWQLWLDPYHRWPVNEDGTIQAGEGHHWCSWARKGHPRRRSAIPRLARLNCHWSGLNLHFKILVLAVLLPGSSKGSPPTSSPKPTVKPKDKTVPWKPTFEPSSITNRITGQGSFQWPNLRTMIQRMQAQVMRLSSQNLATTPASPTRKTSTLASSPRQLTG